MQLNPARGRKLYYFCGSFLTLATVYAAQPREGTETNHNGYYNNEPNDVLGLCSSTPRGDGNLQVDHISSQLLRRFMQLNPARGRKPQQHHGWSGVLYLRMVYAAQPREGTETLGSGHTTRGSREPRFMQLNPARGRKL